MVVPLFLAISLLVHPAGQSPIDWQNGQTLTAKHRLFQLDRVRAQSPTAIAFEGRSFGESGRITLFFYNRDGDRVHLPRSGLHEPAVDGKRRSFVVIGIIPPRLRGQEGMVEVSFIGRERASFYFPARF